MTNAEYVRAKEAIEERYRDDMAALERVWVILSGSKPPDGIVEASATDRVHMRSAESLGIPTATSIDQMTAPRRRQSYKGLSLEEKKARKAEYMKAYTARRRAHA